MILIVPIMYFDKSLFSTVSKFTPFIRRQFGTQFQKCYMFASCSSFRYIYSLEQTYLKVINIQHRCQCWVSSGEWRSLLHKTNLFCCRWNLNFGFCLQIAQGYKHCTTWSETNFKSSKDQKIKRSYQMVALIYQRTILFLISLKYYF